MSNEEIGGILGEFLVHHDSAHKLDLMEKLVGAMIQNLPYRVGGGIRPRTEDVTRMAENLLRLATQD